MISIAVSLLLLSLQAVSARNPVDVTSTQPPITVTTCYSVTAPQQLYGQCGGTGWTGSTECVAGTTCVYVNEYYSQCLLATTVATPTSVMSPYFSPNTSVPPITTTSTTRPGAACPPTTLPSCPTGYTRTITTGSNGCLGVHCGYQTCTVLTATATSVTTATPVII